MGAASPASQTAGDRTALGSGTPSLPEADCAAPDESARVPEI
jgi:hypothetical protein